jgi:hypothetical protein
VTRGSHQAMHAVQGLTCGALWLWGTESVRPAVAGVAGRVVRVDRAGEAGPRATAAAALAVHAALHGLVDEQKLHPLRPVLAVVVEQVLRVQHVELYVVVRPLQREAHRAAQRYTDRE